MRISAFNPTDELRFSDRIFTMRRSLQALGVAPVSGVNGFEPVSVEPVEILGLSAVASGTAVTIRWDPVLARNLRHYEVLIGSLADGSDGVIRVTTQPEYTDPDGGPDTTRYARIRAILADGSPTTWSSVIDVNSGLLVTDSLEFAAALNYARAVYGDGTESYIAEGLTGEGGGLERRVTAHAAMRSNGDQGPSPPSGGWAYTASDLTEIYVSQLILVTIGGPVQVRISATMQYGASAQSGLEMVVLRNGIEVVLIGRVGFAGTFSPTDEATLYIPGISFIELPPPGTHVYEMVVRAKTRTPGLNSHFSMLQLTMGLLEYRR